MKEENNSTNNNNHGAIGTIAGFNYQILYFIFRLLTLKKNECISLEKFEDVGSENGERVVYCQLKHTINGTDEKPVNMPLRDDDLWKTIEVWIGVISKDRTDEEQLSLITNSDFLLISNKKPYKNEFLDKVEDFQNGEITDFELNNYIQKLYDESKEGKNKDGSPKETDKRKQIRALKNYTFKKELLQRIKIEYRSDDDIEKDIIHELRFVKYITDENNAKAAFDYLCGAIFRRFKDSIQKNCPLEYSQVSFADEFEKCFEGFKSRKFVPTNRKISIPQDITQQTFVKQLIDVDYLHGTADNDIVSFTKDRLFFENDYNNAIEHVDIFTQKKFEKNVKRYWWNQFNKANHNISDLSSITEIKNAGYSVIANLLEKELTFSDEQLDINSSNGCYFYFSDGENPLMGWRYDWKNKYNGKEWIID